MEKFAKLNVQFKEENVKLVAEVGKLSRAKNELNNVSTRLRGSNARMKQSLEAFQKLDENLSKLTGDNIVRFCCRFSIFFRSI